MLAVKLAGILVVLAEVSSMGVAGANGVPRPFSPRSGPPLSALESRDVLWSQPPDLQGYKVSSEIISEFGVESKIADDFELDVDTTIGLVTFWGGYYYWNGEEPLPRFNVVFLSDGGCEPDEGLSTYLHLSPGRTFVGYDGFGYPTYKYDAVVDFEASASTVFWCMVQADDHAFPPQWGRQQAGVERACPAMFCSYMQWECAWAPVWDLVGEPWDASFELRAVSLDPEACCLADGSCVVSTAADCLLDGGEPQGSGTSCDPNPCPLAEACCLQDGSCLELTANDCRDLGGQPNGPGTDCTINPCPAAEACCNRSGYCVYLPPAVCLDQDGEPQGPDVSCDPSPCMQACCLPSGFCQFCPPEECGVLGGNPRGEGTDCDPNPCPPPPAQACCYPDARCYMQTPEECLAQGGEPQGPGIDCWPTPCGFEACCFDDGSCSYLQPEDCAAQGGRSQGPLTDCQPDPCTEPTQVAHATWGRVRILFR
jgi:hypothetical protein